MNHPVSISVFEVVGSPLCVAADDGQKVYDRIATALWGERTAVVSFLNVSSLTSAFLNAAIGQLYGTFTEEVIRALLRVENMQQDDLVLLKRVVDTAKQYFDDPERFQQIVREVLEEDVQ